MAECLVCYTHVWSGLSLPTLTFLYPPQAPANSALQYIATGDKSGGLWEREEAPPKKTPDTHGGIDHGTFRQSSPEEVIPMGSWTVSSRRLMWKAQEADASLTGEMISMNG